MPVEEASLKPKRRLLDSDESDKESDPEADDLDAKLTRFCLNFIVYLLKSSSGRYRNEPTLDKELDPLGWWRNRKQEYPILVRLVRKYGQEVCVSASQPQSRRRRGSSAGWAGCSTRED